jgi:hypothetical protein
LPVTRGLLLVVRSAAGLVGPCQAAAQFLAFRRARVPSDSDQHDCGVLGVWIDTATVDLPADVLDRASIRESVGVNGVWSLYWFDVEMTTATADSGTMREALVRVLATARPPHQRETEPLFAPAFDPTVDAPVVIQAETQRLRDLFPGLIGEALVWNTTGVALASEADTQDGA